MSVRIFNTQTKSLEPVIPRDGQRVHFYSCGPTVYNIAHIGNLRAFITADLLARTIESNGMPVEWVMNITDVDDKTIASTIKEYGESANVEHLRTFTEQYTKSFLEDLRHVGIEAGNIAFVNVSDVLPEIQKYVVRLIELGFAYKADDGSTYFSINAYQDKFGDYGSLVGEKFLQGTVAGARVAVDEYEKDNLSDFALWKAQVPNDGGIFWDHPILGRGRPGWHIECTLINYMKFPSGTDIHSGGIDLIFPHHTNELAQAVPVYGAIPLVEGRKMSKSLGNSYTIADLIQNNWGNGQSLRFLMLQSHYRSKLNITPESLLAAKTGLQNIHSQTSRLLTDGSTEATIDLTIENQYILRLQNAMSEDLDTPTAIALIFEVLKSSLSPTEKFSTIGVFERALGLQLIGTIDVEEDIPESVKSIVMQRDAARTAKDFIASDTYRDQLIALGYEVSDTASGTKIFRK
jgi:cysteinyl-tRNA synthetase